MFRRLANTQLEDVPSPKVTDSDFLDDINIRQLDYTGISKEMPTNDTQIKPQVLIDQTPGTDVDSTPQVTIVQNEMSDLRAAS